MFGHRKLWRQQCDGTKVGIDQKYRWKMNYGSMGLDVSQSWCSVVDDAGETSGQIRAWTLFSLEIRWRLCSWTHFDLDLVGGLYWRWREGWEEWKETLMFCTHTHTSVEFTLHSLLFLCVCFINPRSYYHRVLSVQTNCSSAGLSASRCRFQVKYQTGNSLYKLLHFSHTQVA